MINIDVNLFNKEVKVLVVEDSNFMRQIIKDALLPYKNIKVDTASNGKIALKKIEEFQPDVMTLDIQMDVMDGLEFLQEMKDNKLSIPTIMITKSSQDFINESMKLGAIDYILKPQTGFFYDNDVLQKELVNKIYKAKDLNSIKNSATFKSNKEANEQPKLIVIGSSTGGPNALHTIFSRLPRIKTPTIIIQHMPDGFNETLAERLNKISTMTVKIAENEEILKYYTVYLAPGNRHLEFDKRGRILINKKEQYNGVRPSVDITLKSAFNTFGGKILSVILTGMGDDGLEGVDLIRSNGGRCIVQDQESSVVFGMPKAIIDSGNSDSVVNIDYIHHEIMRHINNWN
ncbi:MAG: chemotaxis-specific protein-glutamate methyltransferase CheB [Cyanobacteriota bacterium]